MNEIIAAAKKSPYRYNKMKQDKTALVRFEAIRAGLKPMKTVKIRLKWNEINRRRDPDNIQAGVKFVLDGLKASGIIPDDSQRYVLRITHEYCVDARNVGVEVTLEEG